MQVTEGLPEARLSGSAQEQHGQCERDLHPMENLLGCAHEPGQFKDSRDSNFSAKVSCFNTRTQDRERSKARCAIGLDGRFSLDEAGRGTRAACQRTARAADLRYNATMRRVRRDRCRITACLLVLTQHTAIWGFWYFYISSPVAGDWRE